jgi:hypothetical protein
LAAAWYNIQAAKLHTKFGVRNLRPPNNTLRAPSGVARVHKQHNNKLDIQTQHDPPTLDSHHPAQKQQQDTNKQQLRQKMEMEKKL